MRLTSLSQGIIVQAIVEDEGTLGEFLILSIDIYSLCLDVICSNLSTIIPARISAIQNDLVKSKVTWKAALCHCQQCYFAYSACKTYQKEKIVVRHLHHCKGGEISYGIWVGKLRDLERMESSIAPPHFLGSCIHFWYSSLLLPRNSAV